MATFTFFDEFIKKLGDKDIDLAADVFKIYLSNATPTVATHDEVADLAGITEQNGYTVTTLTTSWTETGAGTGIWRFAADADISWTASGGSFGAFRYAIVYDDTPTGDPLVGFWDFGSAQTVTSGNTATIDLDADFSIFTIAEA